ncbi:MAG: 50S ribosomal protein L15 [Candidatus Rariloculaceae bacterium]
MRLNSLKPARGARQDRKRVGRGHSAGGGKTGGRGMKGQRSRSGGYHKVGFEGGQMPLQRRLPKVGFYSMRGKFRVEVRLHELARFEGETVDLATLKAERLVPKRAQRAKIILSGKLDKSVKIVGVGVTPGARLAIEAAGGSVES